MKSNSMMPDVDRDSKESFPYRLIFWALKKKCGVEGGLLYLLPALSLSVGAQVVGVLLGGAGGLEKLGGDWLRD